jgi:hypothetical protein
MRGSRCGSRRCSSQLPPLLAGSSFAPNNHTMLITKKKHAAVVAGLNAEIVRLGTLLTDQREVKDLMRSSTARTDLLLERLVDKTVAGSLFVSSAGTNFCGSKLTLPDNVAVYVDDHFGGKVIRQEATRVIEINADGDIKTGLTKRKPDDGYGYVLVLNRRDAK